MDKIQPRKWEYRAEILGLVLISISNPQNRRSIESELFKVYPDKRVHYTDEYRDLLKILCEKHGYDIKNDSILKKIEAALTYDLNYKNFTYEKKRELNNYAKKIIDDLKHKMKS